MNEYKFFFILLDHNNRPDRVLQFNSIKDVLETMAQHTGKNNFIIYKGDELYKEAEE